MPSNDICPPPDSGCPYDNVEFKRNRNKKSKEKCQVYDCDSVIVADGKVRNSGVQCSTMTKARPEKIFCCREDDEFSRSELQNRGNQLPFCSDLEKD